MDNIDKIKKLNEKLGVLKDKKVQVVNHKIDLWREITSNAENLSFEVRGIKVVFNNQRNESIPVTDYLYFKDGIGQDIYNLDELITDSEIIESIYDNIPKIEEMLLSIMEILVENNELK